LGWNLGIRLGTDEYLLDIDVSSLAVVCHWWMPSALDTGSIEVTNYNCVKTVCHKEFH